MGCDRARSAGSVVGFRRGPGGRPAARTHRSGSASQRWRRPAARRSRISLGRPGRVVAIVSQRRRNSVSAGATRGRRPWRGSRLLARRPGDEADGPRPGGVADGLGLGQRGPVPLGRVGAGLVEAPLGVGDGRRDVAVGRHHLAGRMGVDHPDAVDEHARDPNASSRRWSRRPRSDSNSRRPLTRIASSGVRPVTSRKTPSAARPRSHRRPPRRRGARQAGLVEVVFDHSGQLDQVLVAGEEQGRLVAADAMGGIPGDGLPRPSRSAPAGRPGPVATDRARPRSRSRSATASGRAGPGGAGGADSGRTAGPRPPGRVR